MKSGGGVLVISAAQLVVGMVLLGLYEGYKAWYFTHFLIESEDDKVDSRVQSYESPLDFRSPMGFIFYLSIFNNIFAIMGLFGVLQAQRELIIGFFGYNAASLVVSFHFFVDLVTDVRVKYRGEPSRLTSYEQAAAAFIFINFLLSAAATLYAVKAVDEIKTKQREDYNRITVLSTEGLQYEADS
mmetsp:Transcript_16491/g.28273  ORF Transcript_16491/g.28273 Transcript_16491/m.28273 type:complete len:185 (-) Transcript_16491:349-903(-)|eukprot:CAMPEP_0119104338 /NCGR_PEP_ID=MMETSP1180-20130426/2571_1 /TAXON_ID=3052 ORGANISM="Chlamydomonas cf sp, Strain CCMP681" /NCGR_SAMPLE_ID=MMETSP1180 /ASSEMBLY_ACC=CAM_ASM_000741 /LENGTH=184 /DNA_ID=CAMNT_0007089059 /DNA_START=81 /DNA_END=635 /DNA_ORIENTATION=-